MVSLSNLTSDDIGEAIRLSHAESWNQTLMDWGLLAGTKENVCLAAHEGDKIIGTATAMVYDSKVAWIGMVLVDREHRGKGLSRQLLSALFEKLNPGLSLKLDATPAGQPVYAKVGFKDEYVIHRMTCPSVSIELPSPGGESNPEQVGANNISEVVDCDSQCFGANRQQLIEYLYENDPGSAWLIRKGRKISGFALGRKGTRFHQIGPVQAASTEDAKRLIRSSLISIGRDPVVVDVMEDKKELMDWLVALGFSTQRHFVRMYKKANPFPGQPERHYLIAGPEFG